jgi:hypothetical protein
MFLMYVWHGSGVIDSISVLGILDLVTYIFKLLAW